MKTQNYIRKTTVGILFLLLALSTTLTYFTFSHAAGFSDVPQNHWAATAISTANADGIMTGTGGGKFSPNGTVSLAQLITILTRMYWPDEVAASGATGTWYAKNDDVATNHGLFNVLVEPNVQEELDMAAPVTRAMMAQVVCNAMLNRGEQDVSDVQGIIQQIPDVSANDTFAHGIAFCVSKGILQGVDKAGNFSPEATLTRAQMSMIYTRIKDDPTQSTEQPIETPVETPTTEAQDLNEWGIPHFRMLDGENVQQMMDRINAVTPAYREGYLTNGKPISEKNIREMAEAILEDMPKGSPWGTGPTYYYNSACGYYGGCGSYACAVSDYIFGEDAPVNQHKNFGSIKVGDIDYKNDAQNVDGHAMFAIGNPSDPIEIQTSNDGVNFMSMKTRIFKAIDGNNNGTVNGRRDGSTIESDDDSWAKNSFIISRY